MGQVTELIADLPYGNGRSVSTLFSLVYNELRAIAHHQMRGESADHTLQPTALVNEAFLKLTQSKQLKFQDRHHFFLIASRAMQRILVDQARSRKRVKRGGNATRVPLSDSHLTTLENDANLIDLNQSLIELESKFPLPAELVRLHIFTGLTMEQCAQVMNTSKSTSERRWRFARAWLLNHLNRGDTE